MNYLHHTQHPRGQRYLLLLSVMFITASAHAVPTIGNIHATTAEAAVELLSSLSTTGYFTVLPPEGQCGSVNMTQNGMDVHGAPAQLSGNLALQAKTHTRHIIRPLQAGQNYLLCFTDGSDVVSSRFSTLIRQEGKTLATWENVAYPGFSAGTIAYLTPLVFSPEGQAYIAYRDSNYQNRAVVARHDRMHNQWQVVGSAPVSAAQVSALALAFSPQGVLYLAYSEKSGKSQLNVKRLAPSGDNWQQVGGAGFSGGAAHFLSLAFAADGTPYLAYQDRSVNGRASVRSFNGVNWVLVGHSGFSAGEAFFTRLAFSPDGRPFIIYTDRARNGQATVRYFDGREWIDTAPEGLSAPWASYTTLAFSGDGTLYAAWSDRSRDYRPAVKKLDALGWQSLAGNGLSDGAAWHTSLAVAHNGTPFIVFSDQGRDGKAMVYRWQAERDRWESVGSTPLSLSRADYPSLSFTPDNMLYAAFRDQAQQNRATVMRLFTLWQQPAVAPVVLGGSPGDY